MRPAVTPSSHSSPMLSNVRLAFDCSRASLALRFPIASHESTSLRFFVTGVCHSALPVTPRYDGSHRQRPSSVSTAGHRFRWATYTPGAFVLRRFALGTEGR